MVRAQSPAQPAALMTTVEVAAYLHVSTRTLERWRAQGMGPRWVRVYHAVRYPRPAVVEFLRAQAGVGR